MIRWSFGAATFGRTPMVESNPALGRALGRDHHPQAFTIWMAGAGVEQGFTLGETDELGFNIVRDPVHVHDIQATILHLLGLDHERLTFRTQGRDFRLTDIHGHLVRPILARITRAGLKGSFHGHRPLWFHPAHHHRFSGVGCSCLAAPPGQARGWQKPSCGEPARSQGGTQSLEQGRVRLGDRRQLNGELAHRPALPGGGQRPRSAPSRRRGHSVRHLVFDPQADHREG